MAACTTAESTVWQPQYVCHIRTTNEAAHTDVTWHPQVRGLLAKNWVPADLAEGTYFKDPALYLEEAISTNFTGSSHKQQD